MCDRDLEKVIREIDLLFLIMQELSLDEMTSSRLKTSQDVSYRGCKCTAALVTIGYSGD